MLLDLNDPLKVIGCLDEPLITPTEEGARRLRAERGLLLWSDDPQRASLPAVRHVRHDYPHRDGLARFPAEPAHRLVVGRVVNVQNPDASRCHPAGGHGPAVEHLGRDGERRVFWTAFSCTATLSRLRLKELVGLVSAADVRGREALLPQESGRQVTSLSHLTVDGNLPVAGNLP